MKWTEIALTDVQPLHFGGNRIGTAERRDARGSRIDSLALHFDTGAHVELHAAVDVSEQLSSPRIFVIEGAPPDTFLLLGGERLYWVSTNGEAKSDIALFREWGDEEYWATDIIEREGAIVIIYEAGVLMIDETLQVRWHKPKLYNVFFVAVDGNVLKFCRDHEDGLCASKMVRSCDQLRGLGDRHFSPRHGRAWHDHPRVSLPWTESAEANSWVLVPSTRMTE